MSYSKLTLEAQIGRVEAEKFEFKVRRIGKSGKYRISFIIPTTEQIYGLTPMPWASGSSWVDGIEKGMSNVGSYLYSSTGFGQSRAGTGLQAKNKSSGVSFRNTPYITRLLNNFKRTLQPFGYTKSEYLDKTRFVFTDGPLPVNPDFFMY